MYDISYVFFSHELRTPMAAVIGLLDILIWDDCLNSEQYATITQIRTCSTALLRLLNNILDLSKVRYTFQTICMIKAWNFTFQGNNIRFLIRLNQES